MGPAEGEPHVDIEKSAKQLVRFFDGDWGKTIDAIEHFLEEHPDADKNEVFCGVSAGRGNPPTHTSGHREGEMKERRVHQARPRHHKMPKRIDVHKP